MSKASLGRGLGALMDLKEYLDYNGDLLWRDLSPQNGLMSISYLHRIEQDIFGAELSDFSSAADYYALFHRALSLAAKCLEEDLSYVRDERYISPENKSRLREAAAQLDRLGFLDENAVSRVLSAYKEAYEGIRMGVDFDGGALDGEIAVTLFKVSGGLRAQGKLYDLVKRTPSDEINYGLYAKGSVVGIEFNVRYRGEDYSVAVKGVADAGVFKANAGIRVNDEFGIVAQASVSAASGRLGLQFVNDDRTIEVGVSGDIYSYKVGGQVGSGSFKMPGEPQTPDKIGGSVYWRLTENN